MKTKSRTALLILTASLACSGLLQAAVNVNAPITGVTVYPDRAMVTRSVQLELPAGIHTITFENLPHFAEDVSFRGSVNGNHAVLLGLNHHSVRHTEIPQGKVADLDKKIYMLENYERQAVINRKEVFEQQKKLLFAISFKSSEEMSEQLDKGGLEITQWNAAFDFVGKSLMAINDSISITRRELDKIDKELAKLKADRSALANQFALESKTVEIDVELAEAESIDIELDYVIFGASWKPIYNARLNEHNQKVEFSCYGEVIQKTGEDWTDVELTLSTAQPSQGAGPGELRKWFLSLYEPTVSRKASSFAPMAVSDELFLREIEMDNAAVYNIIASNYSTVFKAVRKVSIPSGEDAVRAPIGSYLLDRKIDYICRPQNRQAVYRLTTITNQPEAPLLPGQVSIFAGSDYLGSTHLNRFVAPGDEFDLPFGVDNNIEVKREMLKNKLSPKGDDIRIEQTVRIILANNSIRSRTMTVEEPLPVSQDSRIDVDLRDFKPDSDDLPDRDESKAVWTVKLMPGEEKTITFSYRIEYPADMRVAGL